MNKQERRLEIWRGLTPEQRDYDRFMAGVIPQGADWGPETAWGQTQGRARLDAMISHECQGCTCFRSPPCGHCEDNHRDHEKDDHAPAEPYEIEIAEIEAHEENAARERSAQWAVHAREQGRG